MTQSLCLPDFELTFVNKDSHRLCRLKQYIDHTELGLILYFYPKDNTQGCTLQATDFSELMPLFLQKGYQIIGVSRDSIKSHQNFINKHSLIIELISDTDEKLCQYFDVIKEKMMYGKTHLGVVRSTFVFDKHGQLISKFSNVKAKEHAHWLLSNLP